MKDRTGVRPAAPASHAAALQQQRGRGSSSCTLNRRQGHKIGVLCRRHSRAPAPGGDRSAAPAQVTHQPAMLSEHPYRLVSHCLSTASTVKTRPKAPDVCHCMLTTTKSGTYHSAPRAQGGGPGGSPRVGRKLQLHCHRCVIYHVPAAAHGLIHLGRGAKRRGPRAISLSLAHSQICGGRVGGTGSLGKAKRRAETEGKKRGKWGHGFFRLLGKRGSRLEESN